MIVLQQGDAQIGELSESVSFEAENYLGLIDLAPGYTTTCDSQQTWTSTLEATQSTFQETGPLDLPTYSFSQDMSQLTNDERMPNLIDQDFQLSEHVIFNATRDPPMSFRDRHRFLDGVYNSYPDPALITAEDMGDVARRVGLLMDEVLSWFKDEKSRRAELHAHKIHQAQKSACQFPPSPESIRGSGDASPASFLYNATSPRTPSKPQNISPCLESADQKLLVPPKAKRGRPAKTYVKTEPDILTPDAKRMKISVKYPCPDCRNFVPVERWAEHVNRKHFPKHIWECPKTSRQTGKPCSSSSHYRPAFRDDNFATHLKSEHNCSDAEVAELKKTYKFEVTNFFHKICGFCDKSLDNREESIDHIKDHFRIVSEESNSPVDLGVSLWREKCGVEHKLQRGIHYGRSSALKTDLTDGSVNHGRDEDDDDEESGNGNSDNSAHDKSAFRSNNNSYDRDMDENESSGDGNADSPCRDNSAKQLNHNNHTHHHDENSRSSQCSSDNSGDPESIEATSSQDQPSIGRAKMDLENASALPSISSALGCFYDRRSESQVRDSSSLQARRSPTGIPGTQTPQRLTAKGDANFQCHVEGCGTLFSWGYDFKAHLKMHVETRKQNFPCGPKDCDKKFDRKTNSERHQQRSMCTDFPPRNLEDGCHSRCCVETSVGVSIADHTLPRQLRTCKDEVNSPLRPNPSILFQGQGPQEVYPKTESLSFSSMHSEAPQVAMESPELRATSNYSYTSGASAEFSALDSPFSISALQCGQLTRIPSDSSTASGPSAVSTSSIDSPHSIYGHIVSGLEFGLGPSPSIVSYDNFEPSNEYTFPCEGTDDFTLEFNPSKLNANGFVDPSILYPPYIRCPTLAAHSSYSSYPPPRPSQTFQSQSSQADFSVIERGRCTYRECGKVFHDLKAHMLTHQSERPEKCPIQTCDYHIKGFARKYDRNRHTLTHYQGTMVCGFCPGIGSVAEKSFNRADVFKRHLTSVHGVEQTPPNSRKKISGNSNSVKKLSCYPLDATGKCSTCKGMFSNAQKFYEHLDDCVLRIVEQEEPSEALNAMPLAEVDSLQPLRGLTHSKGGVILNAKGRKKRKDYPSSWGCPSPQRELKNRGPSVFDKPHRLWKDDMMLDMKL